MNILGVLSNTVFIATFPDGVEEFPQLLQLEKFFYVNMVIAFVGLAIVYYCTIVCLTFDRLLGTLLHMKYRVYVTEKRLMYLLICTWALGVLFCIISLVCKIDVYFCKPYIYIHFSINLIYLILAIFTYFVIFKTLVNSRRTMTVNLSQTTEPPNAVQVFRNSRFLIAVYLILAFLVFLIIPQIVLFWLVGNPRYTDHLKLSYAILGQLLCLVDAVI